MSTSGAWQETGTRRGNQYPSPTTIRELAIQTHHSLVYNGALDLPFLQFALVRGVYSRPETPGYKIPFRTVEYFNHLVVFGGNDKLSPDDLLLDVNHITNLPWDDGEVSLYALVDITTEFGYCNVHFHKIVATTGPTLPAIVMDSLPSGITTEEVNPFVDKLESGMGLYREFDTGAGEKIFTHMVICKRKLLLNVRLKNYKLAEPRELVAGAAANVVYDWSQWT
jgi:hypothetical protein